MQSNGTAKQVARWVALGALFLVPFTLLIVASSFFFPFITGKAFYLRILVEIALSLAWAVLALLDKEYRPRFSWIGAAVVGFVAWMFIADAFALNAIKAFWSNFERMEGWVLLVHLLGFFFAASAVLRAEKKWRAWFLASLGVSVVIVGYALLQLNGTFRDTSGLDAHRRFAGQFRLPRNLSPLQRVHRALARAHRDIFVAQMVARRTCSSGGGTCFLHRDARGDNWACRRARARGNSHGVTAGKHAPAATRRAHSSSSSSSLAVFISPAILLLCKTITCSSVSPPSRSQMVKRASLSGAWRGRELWSVRLPATVKRVSIIFSIRTMIRRSMRRSHGSTARIMRLSTGSRPAVCRHSCSTYRSSFLPS